MPISSADQSSQAPEISTISGLCDAIIKNAATSARFLVALAGPPAAGKSTTADLVVQELSARGNSACVIPMDGFHYDDSLLDQLGLRSRKGSPPTFDCAGFEVLLKRLVACEPYVAIPVFDRAIELSRAGAALVSADTKFLIIEGNYLLLDYDPWSRLHAFFDMTVFLDVPISELDRRMVARWVYFGRDRNAARAWIDTNDLPNITHVLEHSRGADIRLKLA